MKVNRGVDLIFVDLVKIFGGFLFISQQFWEMGDPLLRKVVSVDRQAKELSKENLQFFFLKVLANHNDLEHHVRENVLHDLRVIALVWIAQEKGEAMLFLLSKE